MRLVSVEEKDSVRDAAPRPAGVLVFDRAMTRWAAVRRGEDPMEGSGAPSSGLRGTWVNNLDFDVSQGLFPKGSRVIIRSSTWFRRDLNDMLSDWGAGRADPVRAAMIGSIISDRVCRACHDLVSSFGGGSADAETDRIFRSASLATGLSYLSESAVGASVPSDAGMREHLERALQDGAQTSGDGAPGDLVLRFRMPALGLAMSALPAGVPAPEDWRKALRDEGESEAEFVAAVRGLGLPVLWRAMPSPDHAAAQAWRSALLGARGETVRSRFVDGEIDLFEPAFGARVDAALIASGSAPCATRGLLDALISSFGGQRAAALSWSFGLLAENIIASAQRVSRRGARAVPSESVWIAAQERIACAGAAAAIESAGGEVTVIRGGRITCRVPHAAEIVSDVISAAWGSGAHLSAGDAAALRRLFPDAPPSDRPSWGGRDEDYLLAAASSRGDLGGAWALDSVCDRSPPDREEFVLSLS
ncbi:MAG: hypothetical protein DI629_18770 [Mesorhizobium amorphae]|nr:MAG: hypothetical protein DI629_18770 [Mesorhizobium amorphae]